MDNRPYGESTRKPPKDGPGPRGGGDCYYTSRVLDSTARYVGFIKKLRALEEEQRKGKETKLKTLKDTQMSDFFNRSDRKSLLNNVAQRVELCMASYQLDVEKKKKRLKELLQNEEENNIRKFVEMAQSGAAAVWQDKKDRLAFLIAKRKKEHEDKFKELPLSKCVHVLPCVIDLQSKEAERIQLYQMKEKEARKQAQKEFDKMWHAVAMKESEALAARMEYDAIQKLRRTLDAKKQSDKLLEQRRINEQKEKERLKLESIYFRNLWEADIKKEEDAQRAATEKRLETARERKQSIADRQEMLARAADDSKRVNDMWDKLAAQGSSEEAAKIERARRKERETDLCNFKMSELRQKMLDTQTANDHLIREMAAKAQDELDHKRCDYLSWSKKTNKECRDYMVQQFKDKQKAKEEKRQLSLEEDGYLSENCAQLAALSRLKDDTDAQERRRHAQNLLEQIEYNKLLKERALQEERDQIKKYQLAEVAYDKEIENMLGRPFFSDFQHAFITQMAKGLKMKEKCPCSKPDYCAK